MSFGGKSKYFRGRGSWKYRGRGKGNGPKFDDPHANKKSK